MPGPLNSILETVGRTPVVRLKRLAPEGATLYAKLEASTRWARSRTGSRSG